MSVYDISFDVFSQVYKYRDIAYMHLLLHEISGVSLKKILRMRLDKVYPVWKKYINELVEIDNLLKEVNEDMPAPKKIPPKDFNEFGLRNIINAVAQGRKDLHEYFYKQTVAEIYVMYRMHCHETINLLYDTNTK